MSSSVLLAICRTDMSMKESLKVVQRQLLILQCLTRRVGTRDIEKQLKELANEKAMMAPSSELNVV